MAQLSLKFIDVKPEIESVLSYMQEVIKSFTKVNKDEIYDMIIENEHVYNSLSNLNYIHHDTIMPYQLFDNDNYLEKVKHLEVLMDISNLLNKNIDSLTNIKGYFIFLNDLQPNIHSLKNMKDLLLVNIYLAQDKTGLIKIGKSKNVFKRLKTFKVSNPSIKILKSYSTLIVDKAEKNTHNHFDSKRVFGEWFDVDFNKVDEYIKSYFCLNTGHNIIQGKT